MFLLPYSLSFGFPGLTSSIGRRIWLQRLKTTACRFPRTRGDGHATTYAVYNIQRTVKKKSIPGRLPDRDDAGGKRGHGRRGDSPALNLRDHAIGLCGRNPHPPRISPHSIKSYNALLFQIDIPMPELHLCRIQGNIGYHPKLGDTCGAHGIRPGPSVPLWTNFTAL